MQRRSRKLNIWNRCRRTEYFCPCSLICNINWRLHFQTCSNCMTNMLSNVATSILHSRMIASDIYSYLLYQFTSCPFLMVYADSKHTGFFSTFLLNRRMGEGRIKRGIGKDANWINNMNRKIAWKRTKKITWVTLIQEFLA